MASGKLASLLIKIAANGAEAEKEIRKLERKVNDFGKKMKEAGTAMSTYLTAPIVAAGAVAVRSANQQLQAEQRLLTALNGRKDVQERLMQQAAELQSRSIYGDEAIIEQQAFLAALGLTETQINDTINAAAQLSAALGMEFSSAVRNLSKTYSGLAGELGESIPALRNLTAEEMAAGAAIAYVNDNYKGFAETAAQTGTGPLLQLKNTLGDLAEQFGTILVPVIQKLSERLKDIVERFQQLSPETREWITAIAALAAAIGPLLVVAGKLTSGLSAVIAVLPSFGAAVSTFITTPVGGAIAALATVVGLLIRAKNAAAAYKKEFVDDATAGFYQKGYNQTMTAFSSASTAEIERALREQRAAFENLSGAEGKLSKKEYDRLGRLPGIIAALEELAESRRLAGVADQVKSITDALKPLEKRDAVENLASMEKNLQQIVHSADTSALTSMGGIKASPLEMMLNNFTIDRWREQMMAEAQKIAEINNEVAAIIQGSFADAAIALGEGIGNLISGEAFNPLQDFLKILGNTLQQLGAALISYAATMEAVKKALATAFATPWVALAAGIAATAAGVALVNLAKKPVKLATGGLAYGPTLAVVGDNPGASSDPEVVAPLSKLSTYLGGQKMELVGSIDWVLEGDSLRAVLNRENIRLSTLR